MKRLVYIIWICTFGSGCSVIANGARTLVVEPFHFYDSLDQWRGHHDHKKMADRVWKDVESAAGKHCLSEHYELGFKDGFADFLDAGGSGEPPVLPPRKYWKHRYQTPEGHQAVEDWFAGFRHGAAEAKSSGYRNFAVVPSSLAPTVVVPEIPTNRQLRDIEALPPPTLQNQNPPATPLRNESSRSHPPRVFPVIGAGGGEPTTGGFEQGGNMRIPVSEPTPADGAEAINPTSFQNPIWPQPYRMPPIENGDPRYLEPEVHGASSYPSSSW